MKHHAEIRNRLYKVSIQFKRPIDKAMSSWPWPNIQCILSKKLADETSHISIGRNTVSCQKHVGFYCKSLLFHPKGMLYKDLNEKMGRHLTCRQRSLPCTCTTARLQDLPLECPMSALWGLYVWEGAPASRGRERENNSTLIKQSSNVSKFLRWQSGTMDVESSSWSISYLWACHAHSS